MQPSFFYTSLEIYEQQENTIDSKSDKFSWIRFIYTRFSWNKLSTRDGANILIALISEQHPDDASKRFQQRAKIEKRCFQLETRMSRKHFSFLNGQMEVEFLFVGSISRRRHKNRSAETNLFAVILVNKKEEEKRNKKIQ